MNMCSLEQKVDGLTDGNDGNTKVSAFFVMPAQSETGLSFEFSFD